MSETTSQADIDTETTTGTETGSDTHRSSLREKFLNPRRLLLAGFVFVLAAWDHILFGPLRLISGETVAVAYHLGGLLGAVVVTVLVTAVLVLLWRAVRWGIGSVADRTR